jgi:hypothetical protein
MQEAQLEASGVAALKDELETLRLQNADLRKQLDVSLKDQKEKVHF